MTHPVVIGAAVTAFGKQLGRGLKDLAREAVLGALADAPVEADALEAVYVGNAIAGLVTGQESIRGQVMLRPLGIGDVPIYNVENACASSSTAFQLACQAVRAGAHEVVLVLGAEVMTHRDRSVTFGALASAVDVEARGADAVGSARSIFMDEYAESARAYFARSGATVEDLAWIASKNHQHASLNPRAQYRAPMSVAEVLADVPVVAPLTRAMCSPIADGAAALIVASERFAGRHGADAVRVLASVLRSGAADAEVPLTARTARDAYQRAAIGPRDLHVLEVHDATASAELIAYDELGLCAPGEAHALVRAGETALGGARPVNPSGGLECRGHPVGATGAAQLVELVTQLRGRAGARQVEGAQVALAHNAGGWLGHENAACVITILAR